MTNKTSAALSLTSVLLTLSIHAGIAAEAAGSNDRHRNGTPEQTSLTPHCVLDVERSGNLVRPVAQRCYATLFESIADASDGNALLPVDVSGSDLDRYHDRYSPWTLGEIYEHAGFEGASYLIRDPYSDPTCYAHGTIYYFVMPDGWNDRVSSARGSKLNGCQIQLWEHGDAQGRHTRFFNRSENVGWINDRTSSMRFRAR